jgi:GntP family gluconate:H+ symporter
LPILIPLVCICADTVLNATTKSMDMSLASPSFQLFTKIIGYLGNKNTAITLGAIAALLLLPKEKKEELKATVQAALLSGGGIILITAAGGAFGGMLQQSGISNRIAEMTMGYQMALIPLAFLISAVVRTAQGSATVALITASGILSGMAFQADLGFHPVYLGLAIGCGSKLVPWMNDSGFWIICKLSNLTEKEALRTITPLFAVMGFTGLIVVMIGAKLFPLI